MTGLTLTKADAEEIAKKLKAEAGRKAGAHTVRKVYVNGKWVATVSIRHGSNRDLGHNHIVRDIHESPHNAKQLAICTRSYEDWVQSMREKGKVA